MKDINRSVEWAVNIANDNSHGYDQTNRLGNPDYDCSSFISRALIEGGFHIASNSWTGNLLQQLIVNGFHSCKKPWKPGDIHLNILHHVAMSVDENNIVHASINENGKTTGGNQGDQTGKEICIRSYYEYSRGWDYHLRYVPSTQNIDKSIDELAREVIAGKWSNGSARKYMLEKAGYDYNLVQARVNKLLIS